MCTLLLRYEPSARWPILVAAVRDEFVGRPWDPPAAFWDGAATSGTRTNSTFMNSAATDEATAGAAHGDPVLANRRAGRRLFGGRDRVAGGTWLAVDPGAPALAAVLNGKRLPPPANGARPSRGGLPLAALRSALPDPEQISRYDGFHLVRADLDGVQVISWDGATLLDQRLAPGDHIVVNRGIGMPDDPVVAHFLPLFAGTPSPDPSADASIGSGSDSSANKSTVDAWGAWLDLLAGDDLDPGEPGALLVRREFGGRQYGSTSVSLVGLSPGAVRYDFNGSPWDRNSWRPVRTGA